MAVFVSKKKFVAINLSSLDFGAHTHDKHMHIDTTKTNQTPAHFWVHRVNMISTQYLQHHQVGQKHQDYHPLLDCPERRTQT